MCQARHLTSVTSPEILDELVLVLREKFHAPPSEIDYYRDDISSLSEIVYPPGELSLLDVDPSDNVVLETALVGGVEFLVTGNKHLLSLGSFEGIEVLRAAEVVRLIASR